VIRRWRIMTVGRSAQRPYDLESWPPMPESATARTDRFLLRAEGINPPQRPRVVVAVPAVDDFAFLVDDVVERDAA